MSMAATMAPSPLTAEQFAQRPDSGRPEEHVRGRVVPIPLTSPRHGEVCAETAYVLRRFLEDRPLGRVLTNAPGVITERGPDTVRGPDVCYYSFARVPPGPLPARYQETSPDLVFEVFSPSDRWPKVMIKVGEFLAAGALVVVVLDDDRRAAHVFSAEGANRILPAGDVLTLPEVFGEDFREPVAHFFPG